MLEQAVNQYFVHIHCICNLQQPFLNDSAEGRKMAVEFMSPEPGRDATHDTWVCSQARICSQTRYRLRYAARYMYMYT